MQNHPPSLALPKRAEIYYTANLSAAIDSSGSVTTMSVKVTVPVLEIVMLYLIKSPGLVPVSPSPSSRDVVIITVWPDDRRRVVEAAAVATVGDPEGALAVILHNIVVSMHPRARERVS